MLNASILGSAKYYNMSYIHLPCTAQSNIILLWLCSQLSI